jgi:hypothetical protein
LQKIGKELIKTMSQTANQLTLFNIADVVQPAKEKWEPVPPSLRGDEQRDDSLTKAKPKIRIYDSLTKEGVRESSSKRDGLSDAAVSTYRPKGQARGNSEYFRFQYRDGKRIRFVHIPGGNTQASKAIANRNVVKIWIEVGYSGREIEEKIKEWRKSGKK